MNILNQVWGVGHVSGLTNGMAKKTVARNKKGSLTSEGPAFICITHLDIDALLICDNQPNECHLRSSAHSVHFPGEALALLEG
jgi:hypothetical protein